MSAINTNDLALQVRAGDYDRFLCIQLAPAARRAALYAVTAFSIELARIAETVSEPLLGHIRLAWWREALEEIMAGKSPRNHPVVLALAQLHAQHPAVLAQLLRMVEARAVDLDTSLLAEEAQWRDYLDGTAGALHVAWALILDAGAAMQHEARVRREAHAYAMVGLLRTIPYMVAHGFWRFPADVTQANGMKTLTSDIQNLPFVTAILDRAAQLWGDQPWPRTLTPLRGLSVLARMYAGKMRRGGYAACAPHKIRLSATVRIIQVKFFL